MTDSVKPWSRVRSACGTGAERALERTWRLTALQTPKILKKTVCGKSSGSSRVIKGHDAIALSPDPFHDGRRRRDLCLKPYVTTAQ